MPALSTTGGANSSAACSPVVDRLHSGSDLFGFLEGQIGSSSNMRGIIAAAAATLADPDLPLPVIDAWADLEQLYILAAWLIVDVWLPRAPAEFQLPQRPRLPGNAVDFLRSLPAHPGGRLEDEAAVFQDVLYCLFCLTEAVASNRSAPPGRLETLYKGIRLFPIEFRSQLSLSFAKNPCCPPPVVHRLSVCRNIYIMERALRHPNLPRQRIKSVIRALLAGSYSDWAGDIVRSLGQNPSVRADELAPLLLVENGYVREMAAAAIGRLESARKGAAAGPE